MTEDEYIAASDLARLRVATHALRDMHITRYKKLKEALVLMSTVEDELQSIVQKRVR